MLFRWVLQLSLRSSPVVGEPLTFVLCPCHIDLSVAFLCAKSLGYLNIYRYWVLIFLTARLVGRVEENLTYSRSLQK
jgi:hypothetical protein